jgi:hypothetical protein
MKEFKVVEIPPNRAHSEIVLNDAAEEGWDVIAITNYEFYFSRDKQDDPEPTLLTENDDV